METVVKPRVKGFICTTAHPKGLFSLVEQAFGNAREKRVENFKGRKALIIGASQGYGLATRIALASALGMDTIGIALEKPPKGNKTATAGWYNTVAFHQAVSKEPSSHYSVNADAFSVGTMEKIAALIEKKFGKIDYLIYSLAAPRRIADGKQYRSYIKPIGEKFVSKTLDFVNEKVTVIEVDPATQQEIDSTVKVMGGENWEEWVEFLFIRKLISENFKTYAYSYIGPEVTFPIYRAGTIGKAKEDLEERAKKLNRLLAPIKGSAQISVNKAVVTQSSAAIPAVPLYIALLYKVMKEKGTHENVWDHMLRFVVSHIVENKVPIDDENRVRMDSWEMDSEIQNEIKERWNKINEDNLLELSDVRGYNIDFFRIFGFEVEGVDYEQPVEIDISW